MTTYYPPAAANYNTAPLHHHKDRGFRLCDACGAPETPVVPKFRLCGGCMTTQYCSPDCQRAHWSSHKSICQHTSAIVKSVAGQPAQGAENIAKALRKFTSTYCSLLSWSGFQALQLKRMPSNIRSRALLIEIVPRHHPDPHCRFAIKSAEVVSRSYIADPLVNDDIRRREDRCRRAGGLGTCVVLIQCEGVSQVLPVEVDAPNKISWDIRDDWLSVLCHFVDAGRCDFAPISTTPSGIHYG
ncbi:hypothetical protein FISHEDRAFT_78092 [Fistulina hepatica ATCC 64428]|nr:hypothetical protein FISHEDRAFT_78092 [Fistulina hepatica ATCC 64428]